MTHHEIKVLEDGTRVYSAGQRYKPMADEDRTYTVRKPADPRAVRWRGEWLLPLDLLSDDARTMPETREDREAYDHMPRPCNCRVCSRPAEAIGRWQRKWQRDQGLHPKKISRG